MLHSSFHDRQFEHTQSLSHLSLKSSSSSKPPRASAANGRVRERSHMASGSRQRQEFWQTVLHPGEGGSTGNGTAINMRSSGSSSARREDAKARKESHCPHCLTVFKRKYDLLQHISAVHEKKRPFKCDSCDNSFAHKGTLSKHVRTVHRKEKPYSCEHCGQRFSEKGNVNKHKQRAQSCRARERDVMSLTKI